MTNKLTLNYPLPFRTTPFNEISAIIPLDIKRFDVIAAFRTLGVHHTAQTEHNGQASEQLRRQRRL